MGSVSYDALLGSSYGLMTHDSVLLHAFMGSVPCGALLGCLYDFMTYDNVLLPNHKHSKHVAA